MASGGLATIIGIGNLQLHDSTRFESEYHRRPPPPIFPLIRRRVRNLSYQVITPVALRHFGEGPGGFLFSIMLVLSLHFNREIPL
jgi:hypothetical protein